MSISISVEKFTPCGKCEKGYMLPIEDYTQSGTVYLKGWACSHCDHNIIYKSGDLLHQKYVTPDKS